MGTPQVTAAPGERPEVTCPSRFSRKAWHLIVGAQEGGAGVHLSFRSMGGGFKCLAESHAMRVLRQRGLLEARWLSR
jgi:hypothetical protein